MRSLLQTDAAGDRVEKIRKLFTKPYPLPNGDAHPPRTPAAAKAPGYNAILHLKCITTPVWIANHEPICGIIEKEIRRQTEPVCRVYYTEHVWMSQRPLPSSSRLTSGAQVRCLLIVLTLDKLSLAQGDFREVDLQVRTTH